ncbi:MAG: cell division protein FtsA [Gammaproteobacteria bacterium]|nr:cell division protein FtsA [Gammaproteobacteria bacterium]
MTKVANNGTVLVGLDVGTTKVAVCIGESNGDGAVEVTGIGTHTSTGVRQGMIVNIDATVEAIKSALSQAQTMAGKSVSSAYVSIGGEHVKGVNSQGNVAIRTGEVGTEELDLALESARAVPLSNDEKVMDVIPQEYVIDRQDGIREPKGMSGTRMDANVHVVTCAKNAVRNITKCVSLCGIGIDGIVVEPIASASSVLADDERELGVCLLDIGGGTTDVAVYTDGAIRHTEVVPMAGDSVTKDIAMTLRTPAQHAEELKIRYACALQDLTHEKESIRVPGVADRPDSKLSRQTLAAVVESRYRELIGIVREALDKSGIPSTKLGSGVVLTGGAANMEGVTELAEEVFNLPVSLGRPRNLHGLEGILQNPAYATCSGLLSYASRQKQEGRSHNHQKRSAMQKTMHTLGSWMRKTYDSI